MKRIRIYHAGYLSLLAFLLGDCIGGSITPGYSYISNAVSELIQLGAKHRFLLSPFFAFHGLFNIIFAVGIVINYRQTKMIFIGALLYAVVGISNMLSGSIFPQDPIGSEVTIFGVFHLVLVGMNVVLLFIIMPLFAIGFKRVHGWKWFNLLTYGSLIIMSVGGIATPIAISANLHIIGILERIVSYTFLGWTSLFAWHLINKSENRVNKIS